MAYGVIRVIPASGHIEANLSGSGGGDSSRSIKILNPNDGVVYIARNRDALSANYGAWDWKVPSQSYAMLPGPFQSVGMFYLDQSGAGRQGEITVYASNQHLDDPVFLAIGRAIQAQVTAMDVTEGTIPANPPVGIARLWVTTADIAHILNSQGTDRAVIDSLTALGGALSGTLPNASLAALENTIPFVYGAGWQDYAGYGGGYFRDSFGIVHLEGLVSTNSVSPATGIFTLPVGYRPVRNLLYLALAFGTSALIVRLDIGTSGIMSLNGTWLGSTWAPSATPNSTFISMSGITFRAAGT